VGCAASTTPSSGQYLITAGPTTRSAIRRRRPLDFRLFTWTGFAAGAPIERSTTFAATYSPEGCILPNEHLTDQTIAEFVSDDGGGKRLAGAA